MLANVHAWLLDRSAPEPEAARPGLPKGVGWLNTLGGVIIALFLVQVITGTLLAMYYSPHPDAAYETVQFIDRKIFMGRLVRGVHHYTDSILIIVLGLHLVRTFVQGAYKPPRELVWLTGIVLLTLVIGFGFTGYLLPWDQNAYWATLVRTKYAGDLPVIGPFLLQLLRGGPEIGALTLTRFYSLHMLLLPAMVGVTIWAHVTLARRKGPTPPGVPVGEQVVKTNVLPEQQLFRTAVAICITVAVIYALALLHPVETEFKANPADHTYEPRSEWYFLSLFQFVKDFGQIPVLGRMSWIPVAVVPGLAMGFLALAPWLDRSRERKASRRPLMIGALVLGILAMAGLTVRASLLLHPNASPSNSLYGRFTNRGEEPLSPQQVELGKKLFGEAKPVPCNGCHKAYSDYTTARSAPDLSGYGLKTIPLAAIPGHPEVYNFSFYDRYAKYVRGEIRPKDAEGKSISKMPNYPVDQLTPEQLDAIGAYLSQDPRKPIITHANPRNQ